MKTNQEYLTENDLTELESILHDYDWVTGFGSLTIPYIEMKEKYIDKYFISPSKEKQKIMLIQYYYNEYKKKHISKWTGKGNKY
jgi:hypothetical protein